jgi:hypothetical protein
LQIKKDFVGEERQTVKKDDGEVVGEGEVGEDVTLKVVVRGGLKALRPQSLRRAVVVAWKGAYEQVKGGKG